MQQNKSKTLLIIIGSLTVSYLILLGYLWQAGIMKPDQHPIFLLGGSAVLGLGIAIGIYQYQNQPTSAAQFTSTTICRRQGTVKWFDPKKGFGFIQQDQGDDLFVHQSEIQQEGFRFLTENERVEFEIGSGKKGPVARKVLRLDPPPSDYTASEPQESISRAS